MSGALASPLKKNQARQGYKEKWERLFYIDRRLSFGVRIAQGMNKNVGVFVLAGWLIGWF